MAAATTATGSRRRRCCVAGASIAVIAGGAVGWAHSAPEAAGARVRVPAPVDAA